MSATRAVFRFDASPALGAGHAMRCLTLAEELAAQGWRCCGMTNSEAVETVPALRNNPALLLDPGSGDAVGRTDWLVVDHYGLDARWEKSCRSWAERILVIDDLADRAHDCDILVDQTFGRHTEDYVRLVPQHCEILTGCDYALLKPAFVSARSDSLARRSTASGLRHLFVGLGATDPDNHTAEALKGIAASGLTVTVDAVLGSRAPHLDAVRAQIAAMTQAVSLHIDTTEMPRLMARADLAIGAAGTSTWERCCLGLPSLMMVIADNQRLIAENVAAAGAARLIVPPRDTMAGQIAAALRELADDRAALEILSSRAATLCDGLGVRRVAAALSKIPGAGQVSGAAVKTP